jgi:hypothetical protein
MKDGGGNAANASTVRYSFYPFKKRDLLIQIFRGKKLGLFYNNLHRTTETWKIRMEK